MNKQHGIMDWTLNLKIQPAMIVIAIKMFETWRDYEALRKECYKACGIEKDYQERLS